MVARVKQTVSVDLQKAYDVFAFEKSKHLGYTDAYVKAFAELTKIFFGEVSTVLTFDELITLNEWAKGKMICVCDPGCNFPVEIYTRYRELIEITDSKVTEAIDAKDIVVLWEALFYANKYFGEKPDHEERYKAWCRRVVKMNKQQESDNRARRNSRGVRFI